MSKTLDQQTFTLGLVAALAAAVLPALAHATVSVSPFVA